MKVIKRELREYADVEKAKILQGFFKTGPGQYGEGDIFLGVSVPNTRRVAKKAVGRVGLDEVETLLKSKIHEERLVGVLILIKMFKGNPEGVYDFYIVVNYENYETKSHRQIEISQFFWIIG